MERFLIAYFLVIATISIPKAINSDSTWYVVNWLNHFLKIFHREHLNSGVQPPPL